MADLSDNTNWFETDASNNKAPPNGWPEGMMPSGVNDTARGDKGALKRFWDRINPVQTIAPASGLWQFTTANSAYPTGYVDGEIYSFKATAFSVGGDQFQVNALGVKPIWRLNGTPIIANDIVSSGAPQIIYQAALNGGAGAFLLLNPFIPISGDGAGGISVAGSISVAGGASLGSLTVGTVAVSGVLTAASIGTNFLQVSGSGNAVYAPNGAILGGSIVSNGVIQGSSIVSNGNFAGPNAYTFFGPGSGAANLIQFDATTTAALGNFSVNGTGTFTNIGASNDIVAAGVFRKSILGTGAKGARIECYGGLWDSMGFTLNSGGILNISPDLGSSGYYFAPTNSFSDARLKTNVRDSGTDALSIICTTPLWAFEWNERGRELMPRASPTVACGFVAQELAETMPFAVTGGPDDMLVVADESLIPYLFRAIQQLTARVIELERLARE